MYGAPFISPHVISQTLGFQRTLQATDLWKLDESREAGPLGNKLDEAWDRRVQAAAEWNEKLDKGEIRPSFFERLKWNVQSLRYGTAYSERRASLEKHWREVDGRKEASLVWALNDVFGLSFWLGGLFKVFGDTAQLMGPLLVKAIINFGKEHVAAKQNGTAPPQHWSWCRHGYRTLLYDRRSKCGATSVLLEIYDNWFTCQSSTDQRDIQAWRESYRES